MAVRPEGNSMNPYASPNDSQFLGQPKRMRQVRNPSRILLYPIGFICIFLTFVHAPRLPERTSQLGLEQSFSIVANATAILFVGVSAIYLALCAFSAMNRKLTLLWCATVILVLFAFYPFGMAHTASGKVAFVSIFAVSILAALKKATNCDVQKSWHTRASNYSVANRESDHHDEHMKD